MAGPAFDSAARRALAATVVVGVLVAWASAIPIAVRSGMLLLALLGWTAVVALTSIRAVRAAWWRPLTWGESGSTVLGAAGIGIAALSAVQLEVIRVMYGRPGLVWNVDWRYAWNHAQAIARFGGVDHALDYSGVPVAYHVGPAWLGGATDRLLGGGMTQVLFGVVPALCVLSAAMAMLLLLSRSGVSRRLAAAAVGVAFCLPVGFKLFRFPRLSPSVFFDADMWFFSTGLMLNSFFAVAVGLGSVVLLLDRRHHVMGIVLGAVGLGSLVQIKPQFFVGLGVLAGVVGVGRLLGSRPFNPRSWTVFIASMGALALAVLATSMLPGSSVTFAAPVWAPGSTGYSLAMAHIELLVAPSLLALLGFANWLSREPTPVMGRLERLGEPLAAAVVTLVLLSTVLILVRFPVREDFATRAGAVGLGHAAELVQWDLAQALLPLRLLLVVCALAGLAGLVAHARLWLGGIPVVIVAGLIVASPLPLIARNFVKPLRAYEAAEDAGLLTVLQHVPRNGELVIASDLADSAGDYRRTLRGILLTAYGGHAFYVANLAYEHHDRADALQRLENLRAFFGSPWSSWHGTWLKEAHITHVLVSDRCLPRWWEQPGLPLKIVGRSGRWAVLEPHSLAGEDSGLPPSWKIMTPQYGRSSCL